VISDKKRRFHPHLNPPPSRGKRCIAYPPYSRGGGDMR